MADPVTLGDLVSIRHGFAFKGEFFVDRPTQYSLVTPGNFSASGGFISSFRKYYDGPVPDDFVLRDGDLLVTMTDLSKSGDTLGFGAVVPSADGVTFLHNQRVGKVVVTRPELVDRDFLQWVMRSRLYRNEVLAGATGTTVRHTSPGRIYQYRFELPPLPEQRAIAEVLGALDDKIASNRRIVDHLQELGDLILKKQLSDLSGPGSSIPEVELVDVLDVIETGKRPKGGVAGVAGGVPSIGAESIVAAGYFDFAKTKYVPREFFESMARGRLVSGDVLLYKDGGTPGNFIPHVSMTLDGFPFSEAVINEHVFRLRVMAPYSQAFLYFWLRSPRMDYEMRLRGTGAAIPGLNSSNVKQLPIPVLSEEALSELSELLGGLVQMIHARASESRTLELLRDALLPALLSGRIRTPVAAEPVGAAS